MKQCAAVDCAEMTESPAFEFCLGHWRRLRVMYVAGDRTFALRWPFPNPSAGWALEIRKCVAALARDENKEFDEEPIT